MKSNEIYLKGYRKGYEDAAEDFRRLMKEEAHDMALGSKDHEDYINITIEQTTDCLRIKSRSV